MKGSEIGESEAVDVTHEQEWFVVMYDVNGSGRRWEFAGLFKTRDAAVSHALWLRATQGAELGHVFRVSLPCHILSTTTA